MVAPHGLLVVEEDPLVAGPEHSAQLRPAPPSSVPSPARFPFCVDLRMFLHTSSRRKPSRPSLRCCGPKNVFSVSR